MGRRCSDICVFVPLFSLLAHSLRYLPDSRIHQSTNKTKKIHNLLKTRGVPGTHDTSIILDFLNKVKHKNFKPLKLPKFNKAADDRFKKELWYSINKRPDVIIFEGWCIGARPQKNYQLKKHINSVEKLNDQNFIQF